MSDINLQEDFSFGLHGSMAKVAGSGNKTMSDSSIGLYPVMDEPSKDWPFSKMLSMFLELADKFFRMPFTSVNCNLANLSLSLLFLAAPFRYSLSRLHL